MLWICAITVSGFLIGATGIGGVLVVPVLHELRGIDFRASIAAASLAFGLPGVMALWRMRSERGVLTKDELLLIGATIPGALLGGLFVHAAETRLLLGALGIATLASGFWGLRKQKATGTAPPLPGALACTAGCAVGFGSALTGTGGPVVLWPVMMAARQELRSSLLVAQAIQLPISICASAIHTASGGIDLKLSAIVGAILVLGALAGQTASVFLSARLLRMAVCLLLIATGSFYVYRVLA
ncbi:MULTISPECIES: sulfite exporter TauE/SafE family protein [unclassified Variovorax]|uniref:sulfite exporter TauE/SafE family protein n=1 Tax=unclassified Variovorax TaxID=663243 RepID=UPI001318F9D6|nr:MULTISPECIES: sulfite exporter TauE/SafE family protein [unclassified Variovorax]VTU30599.1 Sulfite exporter TauE/SafE [Variovorax sp. SRS16]VTU38236.1 Sulfite exporter TauE/SafE [Variovorax sp. PBL-E5]